jgi:hypothetical protein
LFSFEEHNDDIFLVGSYRQSKEHLEWIFAHRYYNIRSSADMFVSRHGCVETCKIPQYVLLYDSGVFRNCHLFTCLGVVQKTQEEMEKLGYPNPRGTYVLYMLGYEIVFPSINVKRILSAREVSKSIKTKYDYSPLFLSGDDLLKYMIKRRNKPNVSYIFKRPLKVGTLFSGIGAFEEALKQLDLPHDIKFACDTGEIELIPLDDKNNRRKYQDLNRRVRKLNAEDRICMNNIND